MKLHFLALLLLCCTAAAALAMKASVSSTTEDSTEDFSNHVKNAPSAASLERWQVLDQALADVQHCSICDSSARREAGILCCAVNGHTFCKPW